jgi:hypothetical protein
MMNYIFVQFTTICDALFENNTVYILLKLQALLILDCVMKFLAPFMGISLYPNYSNGEGLNLVQDWLDVGTLLIQGKIMPND